MTTYNRLTKFFVGALAVAMLMMAAGAHAEAVDQFITILRVKGGARYCTDTSMKHWINLKKGDVLKPGALIQTAEDGQVDVLLGERLPSSGNATPIDEHGQQLTYKQDASPKANVVHVFPSTVMAVDKLTVDRTGVDEVAETQLDLRAGKIMGNVKKLSASSRYEIKIPNGVAGIRGTTYVISANGTVYVLTGSVVISYVDQSGALRTQVVSAGYYMLIGRDGMPEVQKFDPNRNFPEPILYYPTTNPVNPPGGGYNPIIERISPNGPGGGGGNGQGQNGNGQGQNGNGQGQNGNGH